MTQLTQQICRLLDQLDWQIDLDNQMTQVQLYVTGLSVNLSGHIQCPAVTTDLSVDFPISDKK